MRVFSFIINEYPRSKFENDKEFVGHWYAVYCDLDEGTFEFYDPLGEDVEA